MSGTRPLRLVVVNHMHPSVPHVSGLRAWAFARELAARGHQVVLICEATEGVDPAAEPDAIRLLPAHDWREPLVVPIRPQPMVLLERIRSARTTALVRKALVAAAYLRHSGVFTDFSRAAEPLVAHLAGAFRPQAVWGVFGNTDCWVVAQRQARLAGCGWVGDMKDAWARFVPPGLRRVVARRFFDMSASTANARLNAEEVARWFSVRSEVVYSGVDPCWLQRPPAAAHDLKVTLLGGIYNRGNLTRFLQGLSAWAERQSAVDRQRLTVCYAGADGAMVESEVTRLSAGFRFENHGYLSLAQLAELCRGAAVNAYLWTPDGFHHKIVELLCCGRPVVSFPGERPETLDLARHVGGRLSVCRTETELGAVLDEVLHGNQQPVARPEDLRSLTWAAQVVRLERVLERVSMRAQVGVQ